MGIWLGLGLGLGLNLYWLCIAGVVASRAQWRFGILAVGLQMAILALVSDSTRDHSCNNDSNEEL